MASIAQQNPSGAGQTAVAASSVSRRPGVGQQHTLLSDFLRELGVPHTDAYTNRRFRDMPFKTLFGLSKLLEEYGVDGEGLYIADKKEILKLPTPFLAHTTGGFTIVTSVTSNGVAYLTLGEQEHMNVEEFEEVWDGNVFLAYPRPDAREPEFAAHERDVFLNRGKNMLFIALAAGLFLYFFITGRLYDHISTVLLTLFDVAGLYLTFLLIQKSLKIKNATADRVCGILEEGGCDSILELKSSTFFGLFSWSEVGLTYFSVSLVTVLIFPSAIPWLGAINLFCLPFTLWSIWYQKFRAHRWCTLCVSVQLTLWCLFFCYLGGGWLHGVFPLRIDFFVLGAVYVFVLLLLNKVLPSTKGAGAGVQQPDNGTVTGSGE